jgi:hypothetical protein
VNSNNNKNWRHFLGSMSFEFGAIPALLLGTKNWRHFPWTRHVFIVYMAVCEQKTGAFFFDPPRRG